MRLDEIVALLSSKDGSLEDALLKTKVLLHQIGHKDLVPWVNNELTGYPTSAKLPDYRNVQSQPHAQIVQGRYQDPDYLLPVYQLTEEELEAVSTTGITSSIGTIEQQIKTYRASQKGLIRSLQPEAASSFQSELQNGTQIVRLWLAINMADVESILIQVRSRLLDFALELQSVVGTDAGDQELVAKAATVDTGQLFRAAVFNISGGTTIIGSTNVQVNNQRGDIDGLLKEVGKLGYGKAELEELREAVEADKSKGETPTIIDGETSKWYLKALKKVGTEIRDFGIDVVSKVISDSVKNYGG